MFVAVVAGGAAVPAVPRADAGGVIVVRGGGGGRVGPDVHGAGAAHHLAAVPLPAGRDRGAGARGEPGPGRGRRRRRRRRPHRGLPPPVHRPPAPAAARAAAARHDAGRRLAAPARPPRALRLHPPRLALRALPAPVSYLRSILYCQELIMSLVLSCCSRAGRVGPASPSSRATPLLFGSFLACFGVHGAMQRSWSHHLIVSPSDWSALIPVLSRRYPKDSDKIMLAKQTGLTRSQVGCG
jgi:hypothetical protein